MKMDMMSMMSNMKEKEFQALIMEAQKEVMSGKPYSLKKDEERLVIAIKADNQPMAAVFGSYKKDFGSTAEEISASVAEISAMAKQMLDNLAESFEKEMEEALLKNAIEGALGIDQDDDDSDYDDDYCDECGEYDCICEDEDEDEDEDEGEDEDDNHGCSCCSEREERNSERNKAFEFDQFKELLAEGYKETCDCPKCSYIRDYLKRHPEYEIQKEPKESTINGLDALIEVLSKL